MTLYLATMGNVSHLVQAPDMEQAHKAAKIAAGDKPVAVYRFPHVTRAMCDAIVNPMARDIATRLAFGRSK